MSQDESTSNTGSVAETEKAPVMWPYFLTGAIVAIAFSLTMGYDLYTRGWFRTWGNLIFSIIGSVVGSIAFVFIIIGLAHSLFIMKKNQDTKTRLWPFILLATAGGAFGANFGNIFTEVSSSSLFIGAIFGSLLAYWLVECYPNKEESCQAIAIRPLLRAYWIGFAVVFIAMLPCSLYFQPRMMSLASAEADKAILDSIVLSEAGITSITVQADKGPSFYRKLGLINDSYSIRNLDYSFTLERGLEGQEKYRRLEFRLPKELRGKALKVTLARPYNSQSRDLN